MNTGSGCSPAGVSQRKLTCMPQLTSVGSTPMTRDRSMTFSSSVTIASNDGAGNRSPTERSTTVNEYTVPDPLLSTFVRAVDEQATHMTRG